MCHRRNRRCPTDSENAAIVVELPGTSNSAKSIVSQREIYSIFLGIVPTISKTDTDVDVFESTIITCLHTHEKTRKMPCPHIALSVPPDLVATNVLQSLADDNSSGILEYDFISCKTCVLCFHANHYNIVCESWFDRCYYNPWMVHLSLMTCPSLSRLVFHRSNLWLWMFDDISIIMKLYNDDSNASLRHMYWLMESVLEHLPLLGSKHWKFIILKTNWMCLIADFFRMEVYRMVNYDDFEDLGSKSVITQFNCIVFLLKWLEQYRKISKQRSMSKIAERNMKKVIRLISIVLKDPWWSKEEQSCVCVEIIDKCTLQQWKKVQSAEQCQRSDCKKARRDCKKWRRCSSCFVAVYCSKKCAKYDWKYGYHKKNCKVFTRMIRESDNPMDFLLHVEERGDFPIRQCCITIEE